MAGLKIKKGDRVIVLAGRDKGKNGEVIRVLPKERRVLVRGVNMVRKPPEADGKRRRRDRLQGSADQYLESGA